MRRQLPIPDGWGEDPLSEFLDGAFGNQLAAYVHLQPNFKWLADIDRVFLRVILSKIVEDELPMRLLLGQCRASYLAATTLALSGAPPAAYMAMRRSESGWIDVRATMHANGAAMNSRYRK